MFYTLVLNWYKLYVITLGKNKVYYVIIILTIYVSCVQILISPLKNFCLISLKIFVGLVGNKHDLEITLQKNSCLTILIYVIEYIDVMVVGV